MKQNILPIIADDYGADASVLYNSTNTGALLTVGGWTNFMGSFAGAIANCTNWIKTVNGSSWICFPTVSFCPKFPEATRNDWVSARDGKDAFQRVPLHSFRVGKRGNYLGTRWNASLPGW